MTSLSVAVMAHPDRAAMVVELVRALDVTPTVIWDEIGDRHDTGLRALQAHNPAATRHVVIQDDVVPCRDLAASIVAACAHVPADAPVSFYTGRVKPFAATIERAVADAHQAGTAWITMGGIYWGPAVCLPVGDLSALCDWWQTDEAQQVANYDRRMSTWYAQQQRRCWYSRPSLVDHRTGHRSLAGHGAKNARRVAHGFIGTDRSGLEVDWSASVVDVPHSDAMDHAREAAANARTRGRRVKVQRNPRSAA